MSNYVQGRGNRDASIMVLGEAPGASSEAAGHAFAGKDGDLLDSIFTSVGKPDWRSECYVTYAYKYRPPFNQIERIGEVCSVETAKKEFWLEVEAIKPKCILALGETALNLSTGYNKINTWRGSILPSRLGTPKVVSSIDPGVLVQNSFDSGDYFRHKKVLNFVWKEVLRLDIIRAIEESKSERLDYPQRLLRVAKTSTDVYSFIKRYPHADRVFADIETFRSTLPSCCAIAFDEHESLSIPMFRTIGDIQFTSQPHSDLAYSWQFLYELFKKIPVAGQNWKFDQLKMEMLGFVFAGLKSDLMLKAHTINPESPSKGLAFLTSIYTREPYYKDEGKEFVYNKHKIDRLFLYNAKDSAVTAEIDREMDVELRELSDLYHTDLTSFYYDYVVKQHQFYFDLERTGFRVDWGVRQFLRDKYESWAENLLVKIRAAAGYEININSPKQIKELVFEQLKCPKQMFRGKLKSDEDAFANLLNGQVKDEFRREVLTDILEYRRVTKTLGTYVNCSVDYDGKLRTSVRIIGTETGRTSNSILDEPTRPEKMGFAFQTLTKHGDIGADIRDYLLPEEGFVFVNVDLSQAEARIVALLSRDENLLNAFGSIDIHRRTACLALLSGVLDLSAGAKKCCDFLDKESPERFIGKKVRHAGNYNMKWKRFMQEVISDCRRFGIKFNISPFKAKQVLERFHGASPLLRSNFHDDVIAALETHRVLINPFGRIRRFFGRYSDELHKEAFATIPQSTVKDRLISSAIKYKELKMPIRNMRTFYVGESHDALLMQMPRNEVVDICREMKPILEEPIDFSGCSLPRGKLVIPCDFELVKAMVSLRS